MTSIVTKEYAIHFNSNCYTQLNAYMKRIDFSKLFILVDSNTHQKCLPNFISKLETNIPIELIEIEDGETHKTIQTCTNLWEVLTELNADRKALLINLGGGVLTDLGGFIASTYKRGISYVNVPTTLLAMVDASIGGKTGVNLGHLKNQVGLINYAALVLIDTSFLQTLAPNQMRSGLAEMLKHSLIQDEAYWTKLSKLNELHLDNLDGLIYESVMIKKGIVEKDPTENGLRKTLNFGHTLGHAIESYCLQNPNQQTLLHGEAIAIGMILALYISSKLVGFPENKRKHIKAILLKLYKKVSFSDIDYNKIIELLKFDKKNAHGNINFVLLKDIGLPKIDVTVSNDLILEAFYDYAI